MDIKQGSPLLLKKVNICNENNVILKDNKKKLKLNMSEI